MPKQKDLVGCRSGYLVVLSYAGRHPKGGATWRCLCTLCGQEKTMRTQAFTNEQRTCSVQCGVALANKERAIHGMWRLPEYSIWASIKDRCFNPNNKHWSRYGARGITLCDEWRNDFALFYGCIGPRPSALHTVDRVDNDRGYEPGNVRWATKREQARNRSDNVLYTYNGETRTLVEWAEHYGMRNSQLRTRWYKGVRGDALFAPVRKHRR